MPVVSENAADAHYIHRIAMGTEARNGSFGAHHIAAGHSEAFGVQSGELRGGGGRQILGHNQAIVEYHKAVVGLLQGQ